MNEYLECVTTVTNILLELSSKLCNPSNCGKLLYSIMSFKKMTNVRSLFVENEQAKKAVKVCKWGNAFTREGCDGGNKVQPPFKQRKSL